MGLRNNRKQSQEWFRVTFKEVPYTPAVPGIRGAFGPIKKKDDAFMTKDALDNYKHLPEAISIEKTFKCTQAEVNHLEGRGIPGNIIIPDDVVYDDDTTWSELKLKLAEREARINKAIKEKLDVEEASVRAEMTKAKK